MLQINREGVYTNAHPFINRKKRKGKTMIPNKDRVPLSGREYYALRELFGMVSSFNVCAGDLEKRVKSIPDAWRDYRLLMVLSEKLMQKVLDTIPQKNCSRFGVIFPTPPVKSRWAWTFPANGEKASVMCRIMPW